MKEIINIPASDYILPYREIFFGADSDLAINRDGDSRIVKIAKGMLGIVSASFLLLEQLGEAAVLLTVVIQEAAEETLLDWPVTVLSAICLLIPGFLAIGISRGIRLLLELLGVIVGESSAKALEKLRDVLSLNGELLQAVGASIQLIGKALQNGVNLLDAEERGVDESGFSKSVTACRDVLGTGITNLVGRATAGVGASLRGVGKGMQYLGTVSQEEDIIEKMKVNKFNYPAVQRFVSLYANESITEEEMVDIYEDMEIQKEWPVVEDRGEVQGIWVDKDSEPLIAVRATKNRPGYFTIGMRTGTIKAMRDEAYNAILMKISERSPI
jgi:hypothetical protein